MGDRFILCPGGQIVKQGKLIYCPVCRKEEEGKIINKEETYKVKGEDIRVFSFIATCKVCGEEVFDEELDDKTMRKVYSKSGKMKIGDIEKWLGNGKRI
jgi:YgiT-type zinc finger domain-containing protein